MKPLWERLVSRVVSWRMRVGFGNLPGESVGWCGSDLDAGRRWGGESAQCERGEEEEIVEFHFLCI